MEENGRAPAGPLEIERKYLIAYPDTALLDRLCSGRAELVQVYLRRRPDGDSRRVRQSTENGITRWQYNEKRRLSDLTRVERERELTRAEYEALLSEADPDRRPVEKTRWRVPYGGHVLEVDVFPFWRDRAFCEVELEREDEPAALPDWLRVIREVTADPRYTNSSLARELPEEPLFFDCPPAEPVVK